MMKSRRPSYLEMKVYQNAIASGFKKLRAQAGKTIQEISIATHINLSNLQQLEIGQYDLPLNEYVSLCDYYNIHPAAFMESLEID